MGARDYWDRMLVYFGIAEEFDPEEAAVPQRERAEPRRSATTERPPSRSAATRRPAQRTSTVAQNQAGVGVVPPRTFNDAQAIADHFKDGMPVIVNLQQTEPDLAKRLIDFASGLTYGLDGDITRIADKVFLLTPPNVDVTAEERAAMVESGFFNQS